MYRLRGFAARSGVARAWLLWVGISVDVKRGEWQGARGVWVRRLRSDRWSTTSVWPPVSRFYAGYVILNVSVTELRINIVFLHLYKFSKNGQNGLSVTSEL